MQRVLVLAIAAFTLISCGNTVDSAKETVRDHTPTKDQVADVTSAAKLTPLIKGAIVASPILNDSSNRIDVDTNEHTVTLKGTVKNAAMKVEAEKIVKSLLTKTNSTQKLDDQLVVKSS